jgi:adenylate kinase family enzyme
MVVFLPPPRREVVIQCKHWARSSVSALLKYLATTEKPKIDRLSPSRYILATSLELSRDNKEALRTAVAPWISTPLDVYGNEDLNDLLGRFSDVERRHYKLWLASTEVLKTVLHAAILGRSNFTFEELKLEASRYVETGNHSAAKAKLEKLHTVLITGEPGIGKTTLAGQLSLEYVVEHGFQLCVIADSIEEAEAIFEIGAKQIFYFDDFLGRNYLEALDRHEDSHIVGFIKRVIQDKSKRFVLTSRTTILNQGKSLSDLFRIHNVERSEFEIRVDSLTELDRAKILYNHIWITHTLSKS